MKINEVKLGQVLMMRNGLRAIVLAVCDNYVLVYDYRNIAFGIVEMNVLEEKFRIVEDDLSMLDESNEYASIMTRWIKWCVDYMIEHPKVYERIISKSSVLTTRSIVDEKYINRKQVKDKRTNRIYSIMDVERIDEVLYYSLNRVRSVNRTLHEESLFVDDDELREHFVFDDDINTKTKYKESLEDHEYIKLEEMKPAKEETEIVEVNEIKHKKDKNKIFDTLLLDEKFRKKTSKWGHMHLGAFSNKKLSEIAEKYNIDENYLLGRYIIIGKEISGKLEPYAYKIINKVDNKYELYDGIHENIFCTIDELFIAGVFRKIAGSDKKYSFLPFIAFKTLVDRLKPGRDFKIKDTTNHSDIDSNIDMDEKIEKNGKSLYRYYITTKNKIGSVFLYDEKYPMVVFQENKTSYSVFLNIFDDNNVIEMAYLPKELIKKLMYDNKLRIMPHVNLKGLFDLCNEEE